MKAYHKIVDGVKVTPKEGIRYWIDQKTGQVYATDTTHKDYQAAIKAKMENKIKKATSAVSEKVNKKLATKAKKLAKLEEEKRKILSSI